MSVTRSWYFSEQLTCFGDLFRIQVGDVLVPHGAQFDPMQAEVFGGNLAGAAKVRCQLVIDDGKSKGTDGPGKCAGRPSHGAHGG